MKQQLNHRPHTGLFSKGLAQIAAQFAALVAAAAAQGGGPGEIRSANSHAQWRGSPIGTSKMSPAIHRRQAKKRKAVKRARRLGHA